MELHGFDVLTWKRVVETVHDSSAEIDRHTLGELDADRAAEVALGEEVCGAGLVSGNHFITASRSGELWARRKGRPPVLVAAAACIEVQTNEAARDRGAPCAVRIHFSPGAGNRQLLVTAVELDAERLEVETFLIRFALDEATLGQWSRASVERALDAAER